MSVLWPASVFVMGLFGLNFFSQLLFEGPIMTTDGILWMSVLVGHVDISLRLALVLSSAVSAPVKRLGSAVARGHLAEMARVDLRFKGKREIRPLASGPVRTGWTTY